MVPAITVPRPTTGSIPPPIPDNISFNPNEGPQSAGGETQEPIRFDGAGVVQRVPGGAPGTPTHMLVAPGGQTLAYLQPDAGINLDAYVGRPMGVYGKRWHRPDLRTDFIVVRELAPVKLLP